MEVYEAYDRMKQAQRAYYETSKAHQAACGDFEKALRTLHAARVRWHRLNSTGLYQRCGPDCIDCHRPECRCASCSKVE